MRSRWRFTIAVVILAGTALLVYARNTTEVIPARQPLSGFPKTFGSLISKEDEITKEQLETLGPGDFLFRSYYAEGVIPVDLFIAYFPSQRSGDTIHSPKNCLPGSGWTPVESDRVTLNLPAQAPFAANRYLVVQGENRELVLYWFWAHNRAVASEYSAKFYLVADSIRMHRTDGSMIRLTTPLAPNESIDSAQQRLVAFARNITPIVSRYVPQ